MAASAGTVTLNLDANSVKLIQGLQKAQNQTKKSASTMRKDMGNAFKAIAAGAAVMSAAMIAATKVSVAFADNIAKTSKAIGLSAGDYQEYTFAAKRAGIETSQFSSNMTAFVKRVGEAQSGMGPLVSGLKNLDPVLLENIKNSKNQSEALRFVADAIQNSQSATERAAIANAAFSRAGVGMVNMLSDGSKGLDSMAQKARDLGVVLSDELVAKSEDAADKFGDLQEVLKVRIAATVLENADAIVSLANSLITFVGVVGKATKGWNDWMAAQGIGLKTVEDIRIRGDALMRKRIMLEDRLRKAQGNRNYSDGERQLIQEDINSVISEQIALQTQAIALQKSAGNKPQAPTPTGTIGDLLDPAGTKNQADKVAEAIADMMRDIKTFGMTDDQKALINLIDQGATEEQIALFSQASDELRILRENQAAADAAAKAITQERNDLEQEYADLMAGTLSATELHRAAISRVDQLYAMGIIPNAEEYLAILESINDGFAASQQKAGESQDQMTEFTRQAARNMQTAFADLLFDPMEEGFDGMARSFAKTLQRMAADAAASAIMNAVFTAMSGSSNAWLAAAGTTLSGARAAGGPVSAGGSYLVGEKGPEILQMGSTSGMIIPNHELGGGSTVINIDAREQDDPAKILSLIPIIQDQVEQNIQLKMRRGYT